MIGRQMWKDRQREKRERELVLNYFLIRKPVITSNETREKEQNRPYLH